MEVIKMKEYQHLIGKIVVAVAIIKNTFQQVEVSNIQNIDIGGEPVRRNNTFKDCYINGELQNQ